MAKKLFSCVLFFLMNYRILKLQTYVWFQGHKVVWKAFLEMCLLSIFTGGLCCDGPQRQKGTIVSNFLIFIVVFFFFLQSCLYHAKAHPNFIAYKYQK